MSTGVKKRAYHISHSSKIKRKVRLAHGRVGEAGRQEDRACREGDGQEMKKSKGVSKPGRAITSSKVITFRGRRLPSRRGGQFGRKFGHTFFQRMHAVLILGHLNMHPIVFVLEAFAAAVGARNIALAAMFSAFFFGRFVGFGRL